MKIVGLTGSLGMGKSTAAGMLRRMGVPVHDADRAVHRLLAAGGAAVAAVAAEFPGVGDGKGGIDRKLLGAEVFGAPARLRRLEAILHPLVSTQERCFIAAARRHGVPLVVLDVPLLFETGGDRRCDAVIVVWAPEFVRRARVMKRPGMTAERFAFLRRQQMPEAAKRRRADFLVPSGLGRAVTWRHLRRVVRAIGA